jgi:hypothetical protein
LHNHEFGSLEQLGPQTSTVIRLAQDLTAAYPNFFTIKGPGVGDKETNSFISTLRKSAEAALNGDHSEKAIFSTLLPLDQSVSIRVDYWFPEEETILEIALGLRNPLSEFERDVLKAVTARDAGLQVSKLVLLAKPDALKRQSQPWYRHIRDWAKGRGVEVLVFELEAPSVTEPTELTQHHELEMVDESPATDDVNVDNTKFGTLLKNIRSLHTTE